MWILYKNGPSKIKMLIKGEICQSTNNYLEVLVDDETTTCEQLNENIKDKIVNGNASTRSLCN